MGKNKKSKKNNVSNKVTKEVKNEVKKEVNKVVKNEKNTKNVQSEVKKENKKDNKKEVKKENKNETKKVDEKAMKKEAKLKEKEEKQKEKLAKKDAKKAEKENKKAEKDAKKAENKKEIEENKTEKALIKKAKQASNSDTKVIIGMVLAVLIIAFGIFGFYFYKLNAKSVASYNGGKVSVADFEVYYKTFAPMLEYYGYPASIIPEQIVNKAALDQIIVAMAEAEGVTISDEDKASVEEVFSDSEQLAAFRDQGIDIGRMKKLYLNDYLISTYLDKMAADATDEEILEYIKSTYSEEGAEIDLYQYNTSHILFTIKDAEGNALSDADKQAKRQQAENALARVKNGEDFATVAKELSEDTGTKQDGGKYTMYADGATVEEYEAAAKTLNEGEIYATLVETDYGFHIIKLDSKVENGRTKNERERDEYVDNKVNSLSKEKNVEVDMETLNDVIEKLTGVGIKNEESEELDLDDTVLPEGEDSDATEEIENTESTETQAE